MIVAGARVSLPLPRLAQCAGGDLVVPGIPAEPGAREAFLNSGTHGASIICHAQVVRTVNRNADARPGYAASICEYNLVPGLGE